MLAPSTPPDRERRKADTLRNAPEDDLSGGRYKHGAVLGKRHGSHRVRVPLQLREVRSLLCVPQAHGLVVGQGDGLAIGRERDRVAGAVHRSAGFRDLLACGPIPQTHHAVACAGGKTAAIWRKRDSSDGARGPLETANDRIALRTPQMDGAIVGSDSQDATARGERRRGWLAAIPTQVRRIRSRLDQGQTRFRVAPRGQTLPIRGERHGV